MEARASDSAVLALLAGAVGLSFKLSFGRAAFGMCVLMARKTPPLGFEGTRGSRKGGSGDRFTRAVGEG